MKLKNDSRGFTLIELLITVAIMLSILIISITSITGLSGRKGEEAYNRVVNTIETAAEQFVSSNEYYFKDNSTSKVPLKELIAKGYISNVIDPRDGTKIDECTYVNVKKTDGKIKVGKFESTPDSSGCILSVVSGTPDEEHEKLADASITTTFVCGDNSVNATKGWFNKAILDGCNGKLSVKVDITKDQNDNSVELYINDINTEISPCSGTTSCTITDYTSFNSDTTGKSVNYKIKFKGGVEKTNTMEAKIDTVAPTVPTIGLYKFNKNSDRPTSGKGLNSYTAGSWSNKYVFTNATSTDVTSGIDETGYKYIITDTTTNSNGTSGRWKQIKTDGTSKIKYMACDNAKNCSEYSDDKTVKIDTKAPNVSIALSYGNIKIKSGAFAHYKNMSYEITASDAKKNNSRSKIKEIRYLIKNGVGTSDETDFSKYENTIQSGTKNELLNTANKKTVYAVAVDNAGNKSYTHAVGILDNDKVEVSQGKQQCKFTLSFRLLYAHESGQIHDGYKYAVWNVQSTNDTENNQSDKVKEKCGTAPPDNATFVRVNGNESNEIDILTKRQNKKYYCFAVRPLKNNTAYVPKYDDLKWTVQRKHAISTGC